MIFAAVLALTACSSESPQQSEEDAALQQKLIGVWLHPESAVYDQDENMIKFSAYQFTDEILKCHDVMTDRVESYAKDKYTIEDGKFVVNANGRKQYAIIEIKEIDGKDHLFWDIDTKTMEFIRMTDEEIENCGIPVNSMLSSEAELLGIETEPGETVTTMITLPSQTE